MLTTPSIHTGRTARYSGIPGEGIPDGFVWVANMFGTMNFSEKLPQRL